MRLSVPTPTIFYWYDVLIVGVGMLKVSEEEIIEQSLLVPNAACN